MPNDRGLLHRQHVALGSAPAARRQARSGPWSRGHFTWSDRSVGEPTLVEGTARFVGDSAAAAQRSAAEAGEDGVTLNLVNVPVAQAANTILADILGVKYTVDPKVDGRVTIQTPTPVARTAVIDLFQSALRGNSAAIVSANGLYQIVPVDLAPVGAIIQTASAPAAAGAALNKAANAAPITREHVGLREECWSLSLRQLRRRYRSLVRCDTTKFDGSNVDSVISIVPTKMSDLRAAKRARQRTLLEVAVMPRAA